MATVDLSTFQTACAACFEAIEANAWGTAWKEYAKATAILVGLARTMEREDYKMERNSMNQLREALTAAEAAVERRSDRGNRLVTTKTGFSASDRDTTGRVCR